MKILIVGGGVAGNALAGFMQDGAEVTLIDKTPKWGDIGYGIALWGNGRNILKKLGVEKDILNNAYDMPWDVFEDKNGGVLKQFLLDAFRPYGPTIVITRTNLHNALIKSIGEKVKINLGVTVSEIIQENSKACVTFSTGEKEVFDLVVGADGIHSQIRDMVFGRDYLKYYGYNIWAFWTPHGLGSPRGAVSVVSGGKMYFVYPMEDKAIIMLASTSDIDMKDTGKIKEKLHALFSDFKSSVGDMINAIEDPAHLFHDKLAYIDMPVWYKDRVVLLGDAQHATSPITGMGASMALEDAYVLAEELKKISSTQDIPSALENYVKRRDRRIKKFRKISHVIEKWIMVKSPIVEKIRNIVLYVVPVGYFTYELKKLLKEEI